MASRERLIERPRVIGVLLNGHLGDVILRSTMLAPIRRRFPASEIVLIASDLANELFGHSSYVDRTVLVRDLDLGPWKAVDFPGRDKIARLTRGFWGPCLKVDDLLFPGHFTSHLELTLLNLVAFTNSVGYVGGPHIDKSQVMGALPQWEASITTPIQLPSDYRYSHVFVHIARFLGALGCDAVEPAALSVEIGITEADRKAAAPLTASFHRGRYGALFPGASFHRKIKQWPLDRFAEVVGRLGDNGPDNWIVFGAAREREDCASLADMIRSRLPNHRVEVVCDEPIRNVAAALEGAEIAIGNDNGGMHLAVAMGRPTVCVCGGAARRLYFPWGDPASQRAVMHELECWGCDYNCTQRSVLCIQEISAATVADECLAILAAVRGAGGNRAHGGRQ